MAPLVEPELQIPFLCECADPECTDAVFLTRREFADVHSNPHRFTLVPGHPTLAQEHVVDETERFSVSEKPDDDA